MPASAVHAELHGIAGALAKQLKTARVVPLCIDLAPSDITGPLAAWQSQPLDTEGIRRLVRDLSETLMRQLPRQSVDRVFERMWPELETSINEAIAQPVPEKPLRSQEDMLSELIDRVRSIERHLPEQDVDTGDTDSFNTTAPISFDTTAPIPYLNEIKIWTTDRNNIIADIIKMFAKARFQGQSFHDNGDYGGKIMEARFASDDAEPIVAAAIRLLEVEGVVAYRLTRTLAEPPYNPWAGREGYDWLAKNLIAKNGYSKLFVMTTSGPCLPASLAGLGGTRHL